MEKRLVYTEDVETQVFDWGRLNWLSEPRVTGSEVMATGVVTIGVGGGHARHNHEGSEEILYVISGVGEQMIEDKEGNQTNHIIDEGCLIHLPDGWYHSTFNTSTTEDLVLLAIYEHAGPEAALRADEGCAVEPPKKQYII